MKNLSLVFKYFRHFMTWWSIKRGNKPINYLGGAGYYISTYGNPKGELKYMEMKSGRTVIAELIDVDWYNDPSDMVEESYWHYVGYVGEKKFKEMTFREFLDSTVLYTP